MRARSSIVIACALLAAASAACSAILGLDPPPAQDAGPSGGMDATTGGDSATDDGALATGDAGDAAAPACAALDAGGATYFPLAPATVDDAGTSNWAFFGTAGLPGFGTSAFAGGTFDGRYVYFAGTATRVARYDTQGAFDVPASWSAYVPTPAAGFGGAVFDGRYVYFVPSAHLGSPVSVAARYDTHGAFDAPGAWTTFDLSTLAADGGAPASGFFGAVFDGRYVYFVPRNDGAPDGRVLRYDTSESADAAAPGEGGAPEAGAGDAGDASTPGADAGEAGGFGDPSLWASFDVTTTNPQARGFAGGVAAAGSLFLVPYVNDVYDAAVHMGANSLATRHTLDASFGSSWSTFDMTLVNGLAEGHIGGAFDGQYVYFAPRANGIATRFDTSAASLTTASAWSAYDTSRVALLDGGGIPGFQGAAFDGRFVYFVPASAGVAPVTRYDTLSPFSADCAWSSFDPSPLAPGALGPFMGAVFDGQYVYLIPVASPAPIFARFMARTPAALPDLPNFHGSFL